MSTRQGDVGNGSPVMQLKRQSALDHGGGDRPRPGDGCRIAVVDSNRERLDTAVSVFTVAGGEAFPHHADA